MKYLNVIKASLEETLKELLTMSGGDFCIYLFYYVMCVAVLSAIVFAWWESARKSRKNKRKEIGVQLTIFKV